MVLLLKTESLCPQNPRAETLIPNVLALGEALGSD